MKDWPVIPSLDELKEYKVVVSTLMTAGTLSLMEMSKGWFTHIFIDEAAQVLWRGGEGGVMYTVFICIIFVCTVCVLCAQCVSVSL